MKLFALLLTVCSTSAGTTQVSNDMALAVFRSALTAGTEIQCLRVNGKDAPTQFLAQLADLHTPLALGSECRLTGQRVTHVKSGKPASFVEVANLVTDAYGYTTVDVSTYKGPLDAGTRSYSVKQQAGRWVVEFLRVDWVS